MRMQSLVSYRASSTPHRWARTSSILSPVMGTRICVVSEIEGSRSTTITDPREPAAAASENDVVVLPTPPLLLETAMMSVMIRSGHYEGGPFPRSSDNRDF